MDRAGYLLAHGKKVFRARPNPNGYTMPTIIGFDTETNEGPPITVQFYSDMLPRINDCLFVTEKNVMEKSFRHLAKHCKEGDFVIYGHNLKFDLLSLFYNVHSKLVMRRGDFEFSHRDWKVYGVYGQPTFCMLERPGVRITFVDTFSWFTTSLAKVAQLICPDLPKLAHPKGLGTTQYTKDDDHFVAYAMRDAEVAYYAGLQIDQMHKRYLPHQD